MYRTPPNTCLQVRVKTPSTHRALFPRQDLALQAAANLLKRYDARVRAENEHVERGGSKRRYERAAAAEEDAVAMLREILARLQDNLQDKL